MIKFRRYPKSNIDGEKDMKRVERFSVTIPRELLRALDRLVKQSKYKTRSEAIRDLIRARLVQVQWKSPRAEVVGIVSIVYDHHKREVTDKLVDLQHGFLQEIISVTHIHLDHDNCLEVIILRGKTSRVNQIANLLTSTVGVKHGGLLMSTTGKSLS